MTKTSFHAERENMVREQLLNREIMDIRVIDAFLSIPRELFVPENLQSEAYHDTPLPIGGNSTISQPYVQALMTQQLCLKSTDVVLEVGTGSGYQAAILAHIAKRVVSIDINSKLVEKARKTLQELSLNNITLLWGDGKKGDFNHAPYDKILFTAAISSISPEVSNQLKDDGYLVAPIGPPHSYQTLARFQKENGQMILDRESIGVRFMPIL